jgi:hypothetical protein
MRLKIPNGNPEVIGSSVGLVSINAQGSRNATGRGYPLKRMVAISGN